MPRYLVEFTDGTSVEYGAPGSDTEKIRETVKKKLENSHNKQVASLKKVKIKDKVKKEKKDKTKTNSKKSSIGLIKQTTGKGKTKGKVSKSKNNSVDNNSVSVAGKLNSIENSLETLFSELQELKASMILSRRRQLIGELELLESQIL